MIEELKAKAAAHWKEWLPKRWESLQAAGALDQALTRSARLAEREIREWMERGARLDEAEEIVLPQYILLTPENPGSLADEELDQELAQIEAATLDRYRPSDQGTQDLLPQ